MRELFGSAYRFVIVGILATLVHVGVFLVLDRGLGLHPTLATVLAFLAAVGISYQLNRNWTFRAAGRHTRQLPRFMLVALTGVTLNAAIMHTTVEWLGYPSLVGLALVIVIVPGVSFLGQRYWGFR